MFIYCPHCHEWHCENSSSIVLLADMPRSSDGVALVLFKCVRCGETERSLRVNPGDKIPVIFADECSTCQMCGEPMCPRCDNHYADCGCPGPASEEGWIVEENTATPNLSECPESKL